MADVKYDVWVRNGKERFLLIPEKDYEAMRERLEDDADFRAIEASKKRNATRPLIPHAQVLRHFALAPKRKRRK